MSEFKSLGEIEDQAIPRSDVQAGELKPKK